MNDLKAFMISHRIAGIALPGEGGLKSVVRACANLSQVISVPNERAAVSAVNAGSRREAGMTVF
ncbi:hypothetical protein ABZS68_36190 [Streptomyces sp. NPDC005571]|uniref:hypothetical protein n=1 Tax=Streptomyces sp. NPDC005571 TaxID=3156888 RepID=UPI0033BBC6D6